MKNKKIVEFPNLKHRLLEKAMETMKEKKFQEALELFLQARENNYAYAEVELGMVVCYMELGQLTEAKNRCKKMLQEDIGDYFHVLQIYITILIQLKEYEEVKTTIEAILEEDKLPAQYAQSFYQLLEFARKMLPQGKEQVEFEPEYGEDERLHLQDASTQKQFEIIQSLKQRNIRPLIPEIQDYLKEELHHPVLKTFLVHILKEQGWDKEMEIVKLGQRVDFNPTSLKSGEEDPFLNKVITILEDKVESENPTLFESLKEMLVRIHTVLCPLSFDPDHPAAWAAGLHSVGGEMFGLGLNDEDLGDEYSVLPLELLQVKKAITKLEDFSYLRL